MAWSRLLERCFFNGRIHAVQLDLHLCADCFLCRGRCGASAGAQENFHGLPVPGLHPEPYLGGERAGTVSQVRSRGRSGFSARRAGGDSGARRRRAAAAEPPLVNGGTVIQANLTGYNLVLIISMENKFYQLVFVRPGITSLEQLKGKKLGISGFGSITHYAAQILLKHLSLEPNKDVALIAGGPDAERLGAMSAGKIDASFFNLSTAPIARKMGFVDLLQIADLGVEVQGNGLATSRAYLKSNRDTVKNAMKGYLEAIHFIHANKAEAQKVFAKYMRTNDPEVLETSYQNYVKTIARKPTFSTKGIQFILDMLAPQMPQAKSAKPEQFFDPSLMNELEKEGFF